jgi:hypothetical protein
MVPGIAYMSFPISSGSIESRSVPALFVVSRLNQELLQLRDADLENA